VGFVVDKVHRERSFSEFFGFSCEYNSTVAVRTHLSPPHEVCDSPEQAVHYHTLGTKLGASSLTRHLAGTEERSIYIYFLLPVLKKLSPK
jgi:hypothetical protein